MNIHGAIDHFVGIKSGRIRCLSVITVAVKNIEANNFENLMNFNDMVSNKMVEMR